MNIIEKAADTYNVALNQNTPAGKELENIRRGTNFAGTFYQDITRAIARVKEGEHTKEKQDTSTQDVLASILADMNGASRGTMGQVQEASGLQGQKYSEQPKEEPDIDDCGR